MANRKHIMSLENPTITRAADFIKIAISEHKVILLVGNCWVEYKGRASSKLETGERIVIIKEDGSVLVHRPSGYEPVNWQPSGCFFQTKIRGNVLRIRASRTQPSESVNIFCDRIILVSAMRLIDNGEFNLHASESDMQKAILIDPSILEDGFQTISYEKKVDPGFVDIYGLDSNGNLVIAELKRKTANRDAALQLAKYVDNIRTLTNREIRGILVAPRLAKGVQTLLEGLKMEFKALDPKKCAQVLQRSQIIKLEDFFEWK